MLFNLNTCLRIKVNHTLNPTVNPSFQIMGCFYQTKPTKLPKNKTQKQQTLEKGGDSHFRTYIIRFNCPILNNNNNKIKNQSIQRTRKYGSFKGKKLAKRKCP